VGWLLMLVQGASRCGVPCPECSGVCEGLAAACHTWSVVGGMARSLSTPFSAVIMPGCAHGGCLWSHCQVIVTCLTLGTGRTCSQASMTYCASSNLSSSASCVQQHMPTPPVTPLVRLKQQDLLGHIQSRWAQWITSAAHHK
jgi:hypothetical protein